MREIICPECRCSTMKDKVEVISLFQAAAGTSLTVDGYTCAHDHKFMIVRPEPEPEKSSLVDRKDVYPDVDVSKLDLDYILGGTAPLMKVCAYFARGEFHEEHYMVHAIEMYLLSPEQRDKMDVHNLTIEKMLNGRYGGAEESVVCSIYKEWNDMLGFKCFG